MFRLFLFYASNEKSDVTKCTDRSLLFDGNENMTLDSLLNEIFVESNVLH